jgi:AcrR family transcriptional regulator
MLQKIVNCKAVKNVPSTPPPTGPEPPLLAKLLSGAAGKTEEARDRILRTAIEQVSDFGVRRFTVDELARRVGLSRVTIYRHFPSKRDVLEAALLLELRGFMVEVDAAVSRYVEIDERAVEGFVFAVGSLRRHAVLQRLLRTEPELILPLLTTQGGPVVETGREFIANFARGAAPPAAGGLAPSPSPVVNTLASPQLEVLSEILARMILSFVLTPESIVALETEAELRAYAERYIGSIVRAFTAEPAAMTAAHAEP